MRSISSLFKARFLLLAPLLALAQSSLAQVPDDEAGAFYSAYHGDSGGIPELKTSELRSILDAESSRIRRITHSALAALSLPERMQLAEVSARLEQVRLESAALLGRMPALGSHALLPPGTAGEVARLDLLLSFCWHMMLELGEGRTATAGALDRTRLMEQRVVRSAEAMESGEESREPAPPQPWLAEWLDASAAYRRFRDAYMARLAQEISSRTLAPGFVRLQSGLGMVFGWKPVTPGEILPSGRDGILSRASTPLLETPASAPGEYYKHPAISGGFAERPQLLTHFGTLIETVSEGEARSLLDRHKSQVPQGGKGRDMLRLLARDRGMHQVLSDFLARGGRISAGGRGGRYLPRPLSISYGTDGDELETQKTLLHETLHHLFDRTDSAIWESAHGGGADHPVIAVLEARLLVLQLLRQGKLPVDPRIQPLGFGPPGSPLKKQLQEAAASPERLLALAESGEIHERYVATGMLELLRLNRLAEREALRGGRGTYRYSDEQLQDLAFMHSFTASVIQESARLGARIALAQRTGMDQALAGDAFRSRFHAFIRDFAGRLRSGERVSPRPLARELMDRLLP